jgi:DNA-binding CsgD family transcriptional regulator
LRGDLERARAELIAVQPATESRYNSALASAWGTLVAAHLDDRDLIETWFDGFEADVWAAPEIEHGAGFAEIMVRRGRQRDAEALLHKAIPDCEMVRGNVFTFLAAGRYGRPGDRVRARAYLARAADAPVETPERPALLLFDAIVSEREGRVADARTLARDAADGFGRLRIPLLEAAARETAGDRDGALALYRRCGATYDVRRLTATAESSSASVLSPRESEVALLAAEGRPNLEIAQTLSITHKTVEKHLASIYRKLDISSRARLGTYFAREARKK